MRVTIGATIAAAAAFACLFGYSVAPAGAHKGASGIVKERMDDMKLLKTSMKALSKVVQGKLDFSQGLAVKHGRQIAAVAARMPKRFPHGTNAKPSEALDSIWKEWPEFQKSAEEMRVAAVLIEQTKSASAFRDTFGALGATCRSCHKRFRKPD